MTIEMPRPTLIAEEETYMARLTPPVVPAAAQRRVDLTLDIPQEGIGRDAVLAAYYPAMPAPLPDPKSVVNHLVSWASNLPRAAWYRTAFPQAAVIFRDPKVMAFPDTIADVLWACTEHLDPLSRYSAGWVDSLKEYQPTGLRGPVATAVREVGRYAAGQVVRAMVSEPGIRSSQEALEAFLVDPSDRHAADARTALDAFLTKMESTVRSGIAYGVHLTPEHLQLLGDYAAILSGLGAEDITVDAKVLAKYRATASQALDKIIRANPGLLANDYLAVAFESLMKTYVNKLVRGESVADFSVRTVRQRIAAKKADAGREARNAGDSLDDDQRFAVPRALTVQGNPADTLISIERVLEKAIGYLDNDRDLRIVDGSLCWEAEIVRAEFSSELREDDPDNSAKRRFRLRVREAWMQQRPTNARSTSAVAAVADCEMLLRTTLNRAQRDLDNEFGGGEQ